MKQIQFLMKFFKLTNSTNNNFRYSKSLKRKSDGTIITMLIVSFGNCKGKF